MIEQVKQLKYNPLVEGNNILSHYPELDDIPAFRALYKMEDVTLKESDWILRMIFLLYQDGSPIFRIDSIEERKKQASILLLDESDFDLTNPIIVEAVIAFFRVQNTPELALISVGEERFYYLLSETLKPTGTLTADKKAHAEQRKTENYKDAEQLLESVKSHKNKLLQAFKELTGIEAEGDQVIPRNGKRKSVVESYAKKDK